MTDPEDPRPDGPANPEVGSLAEETAKLLGALNGWAREHGAEVGQGVSGLAGHAAHAAQELNDHLATGAAECTVCPICRAVHAVRQLSPEVKAHLGIAASSLMQAAAGVLATVAADDARASAARGDNIERIDLEDEGEWPEEDQ